MTSKVRAQWPTMTSAGAERENVPGAFSGSRYESWLIVMSSMANRATTPACVTGLPPRVALQGLANGTLQLPHTSPLVTRYTELEQRLTALMPMDIGALIESLFPNGNAEVATIRQIALLIATNVQTPSQLLNELRTDITQPELPGAQGNAIRIMSLHKSKGLTARLVVIAGCVTGIVPSIEAQAPLAEQNRQRQEQRRLFFVGITRSTNTLVLSSAVRMPYAAALQMRMPVAARSGPNAILQASPFLGELGPYAPQPVSATDWRMQLAF